MQLLVNTAMAPEVRLPDTQPLTLTRNFSSVVLFCFAALATAPAMIAWIASLLLG
jgi:hypothetical protein